jgi:hypothetical protein
MQTEAALANQQIDQAGTRATAHLPGLEIEIVHRRSLKTSKQISRFAVDLA